MILFVYILGGIEHLSRDYYDVVIDLILWCYDIQYDVKHHLKNLFPVLYGSKVVSLTTWAGKKLTFLILENNVNVQNHNWIR